MTQMTTAVKTMILKGAVKEVMLRWTRTDNNLIVVPERMMKLDLLMMTRVKDISCQSRRASNQLLNAKPRNSTWIAKKRSLSYKRLFCKGSRHLSQLDLKLFRAVRISRLNLLPQWNSYRAPISITQVKPETSRSIRSLSQWLIRNRQSW